MTFDSSHKYLARVVAVKGKKVKVRRFNKKTGEWQNKEEILEPHACIPLTAAEAESSFPGSVAAWDKTKTRENVASSNPAVEAAIADPPNIQNLDISAPQTPRPAPSVTGVTEVAYARSLS